MPKKTDKDVGDIQITRMCVMHEDDDAKRLVTTALRHLSFSGKWSTQSATEAQHLLAGGLSHEAKQAGVLETFKLDGGPRQGYQRTGAHEQHCWGKLRKTITQMRIMHADEDAKRRLITTTLRHLNIRGKWGTQPKAEAQHLLAGGLCNNKNRSAESQCRNGAI
jgi:hypothetical protein